eukprot:6190674-Pleurochrysis_carterae.AAC.1
MRRQAPRQASTPTLRCAGKLAKVHIGADSNIKGRSGVKACCIRGRLPTLTDRRLNTTVEVRWATRALQLGGQADAKGVPAVARCLLRAQAVRKQGGYEFVGMGRRERRSVASREKGS